MALHSPMLEEASVEGARGVLINITGGPDMTLEDIQLASETVYEAAGTQANVIFGAVIDPAMFDRIFVTVIAAGFDRKDAYVEEAVQSVNLFGEAVTPGKVKRMRPKRQIFDKITSDTFVPENENFKVPTVDRYGLSTEAAL
jgi:cell division protein FtsZ